jgi:large subunit ribosomal protein L10
MPRMKRSDKEDIVAQMADKLARSQIVIIAEYKGINVEKISDLRNRCRDKNVEVKVFKNRLVKLAMGQAELPIPDDLLTGQNLFSLGYDDPVAAAKALCAFAKDTEQLVIKGGLFEGRIIDPAVIAQLSKMPSFDEIMAKIVGGLKSPITKVVRNTKYPISYLTNTLKAIGDKEGRDAA